jgi:hypothetical protein
MAHVLAPLQIGAVAPQVVLVKHPTQVFVVVSQTGVAPEQCWLAVHWTQEPSERQAVADVDLAAH